MTDPPIPCSDDPRLAPEDPDLIIQPEVHVQRLLASPDEARALLSSSFAKRPWIPGADRTSHYFGDRLSSVAQPNIRLVLLHSTETSGMPGYQGGLSAPNATAQPNFAKKRVDFYHHFRINQSSRALLHPPGTVATNTSGVMQVECIGTTVKGGPGLYLHDAPDWWYRDMAAFLEFMHGDWGVPLVSPKSWKLWDASYGLHNGVRYTDDAAWLAARGVIAHMHARNNDHGDVPLDISKLLSLANGGINDMALTADDKAFISKTVGDAVQSRIDDIVRAVVGQDLGRAGGGDTVGVALQTGLANSNKILELVEKLAATPPKQ